MTLCWQTTRGFLLVLRYLSRFVKDEADFQKLLFLWKLVDKDWHPQQITEERPTPPPLCCTESGEVDCWSPLFGLLWWKLKLNVTQNPIIISNHTHAHTRICYLCLISGIQTQQSFSHSINLKIKRWGQNGGRDSCGRENQWLTHFLKHSV